MKKFTNEFKVTARADIKLLVAQAADVVYAELPNIQEILETKLADIISQLFKLKLSIPADKRFDAHQHHDTVIKFITTNFPKDQRTIPYKYTSLTRLKVLLNSILSSKVKLHKVAMDTLEGLIKAELNAPKGRAVTLSELINLCPLKVDIKLNSMHVEESDVWSLDEIKTQFIAELAQLDLIDMKVSDHTHMVSVPTKLAANVPTAQWQTMWELANILGKKTISLDPIPVATKGLVTTSSWYYQTPVLSDDLHDTIQVLNSTKFQFVPNALDLIESAYITHLKGDNDKLPAGTDKWLPARVAFFKEQIQASLDNDGHYVEWSIDSVGRMYVQSEIGHFQTSAALRSLAVVADINNKVKYDFRNNVVQMYSLLLKTRNLAKYVYLTPEADRFEDIRSLLAQTLNSKLECDVFCKDNIKPLFMVWAYNAGKDRILDGVTVTEENLFGGSHTTVKVEGLIALTGAKNTPANRDLIWSAFHETVVELAPEIVLLKAAFKKLLKHNPLIQTQWTLPDGTIAQYASAETVHQPLFFVDSKGKQHQHTQYRKVLAENAKSAGLLPRVIHSFDAYVARQLVLRGKRVGITIVPNHDSFTFDVQYEATVFKLVDELFIELLESDYLAGITTQLNTSGKSLAIKDTSGNYITSAVMHERYGKLTAADLAESEPLDLED